MKMNSHIIKRYLVAVMAPLCSVPVLCSAVVIGDFEGGTDGWLSNTVHGVSLGTSGVWSSLNSNSLQVTDPSANNTYGATHLNIVSNTELLDILQGAGSKITADFYATPGEVPAGLTIALAVYGQGFSHTIDSQVLTVDGTTQSLEFVLTDEAKTNLAGTATWKRVGFSANSTASRVWYVDNIQAIGPPPSTTNTPAATFPEERYEEWLANYPTLESQALESNLYYYAIDANPTNPTATGHHPEHLCGSDCEHIDYVLFARNDAAARGLVYTAETTDNLVAGSWTNEGFTVVGTNAIDTAFTAVTNRLYTTDANGFMRLKVEAQFLWHELDDFGGLKALAFDIPNNGFFRTSFTNGQWWMVTPQNHAYLSFGLNHFHNGLWRKSYNQTHWETEFGGAVFSTAWKEGFHTHASNLVDTVRANSLGYHNEEAILLDRPPLRPYFRQYLPVRISSHMQADAGDYTDVFAPSFVTHCANTAQTQVVPHTNDTMIIGFVMTDVPFLTEVRSVQNNRPTWAMALRNLPASAPGKQAYVTEMQSRYATIGAFNTTYGTGYGHWTNLLNAVDWRPTSDANNNAEIADQNAFNRLCIDKYYEVAEAAFRAVNQNHLFFGDKLQANMFDLSELELMVDVAKDYVDVLLYQFYGQDSYQLNIQNTIADTSNLPMMNGDGGFGFAGDPNMPNQQTPTAADHEQRAEWLYTYAEDAFNHPNFVGWHLCGVIDQWVADSPNRQKPGIMNPVGVLHTNEVNAMKSISFDLYKFRGIE